MKITRKDVVTTKTFGELKPGDWFLGSDDDLCLKLDLYYGDSNTVCFSDPPYVYTTYDHASVTPVDVELIVSE